MPSYVVVGGSRGIGLELVRQLSANKANTVVAVVRSKAKSFHLAELLQQRSNTYVVEADVVDSAAMKAAATETSKILGGGLDFLVHNAARMENENLYKSFLDYPSDEELDAEFIASFRVNVLGIIHSINAFLPLLRQRPTKKILVISSAGGDPDSVRRMNISNMGAYATTRAGSNMAVTKYAKMLESEGFLVISTSPGIVDVSATAEFPDPQLPIITAELQKVMPGFKPKTPQRAVEQMLDIFNNVGPDGNGKLHIVPL